MKKTMLITGAAGFIGNAACVRFRHNYNILAVDDMSRPTAKIPSNVPFAKLDAAAFSHTLSGVDVVIHLAAQVSAVDSIQDPAKDFVRNASLTAALSHWASKLNPQPIFIYANTNKVFGELRGVTSPILDSQPLDPCTPYGISKATGGMYVREFLPDTGFDFRQSCIFGHAQLSHGTVGQGWVGYVASSIRKDGAVTCFGDGKQVRDLLHVGDLIDVYEMAIEGRLNPGSYNIGGGPENAFSFEEVVRKLGGFIAGYRPKRPKDQDYCVMAADGLRAAGWAPQCDSGDVLVRMGFGERKEVAK